MIFEVTQIEFDFSDAFDPVTDDYKQYLYDQVLGDVWEADDEFDLTDEITACTGWCIKSIDFRNVLTDYIKHENFT